MAGQMLFFSTVIRSLPIWASGELLGGYSMSLVAVAAFSSARSSTVKVLRLLSWKLGLLARR